MCGHDPTTSLGAPKARREKLDECTRRFFSPRLLPSQGGGGVKTAPPTAARDAKQRPPKKTAPSAPVNTGVKASAQAKAPPRLLTLYRDHVIPAMMKRFGYTNPLQVPRLDKIVINMGVGEAAHDAKILDEALATLTAVTGQKPVTTRAKKAISNFHIRRNDVVGCRVTLRKHRMYEFFDRFVNVALPRIRDFRGVSPRSFDQQGNYTLGIREQAIFPELEFDRIQHLLGMDITFVTTAAAVDASRELLTQLGMPFGKP